MNNKEIVIKELDKCVDDYYRKSHPIEEIATNLLSKLNNLNRGNVEKICERMVSMALAIANSDKSWHEWNTSLFKKYKDQIMQLTQITEEPLKDRSDWYLYFNGKFSSLPNLFRDFYKGVNKHCKNKFKLKDIVDVKIFIKRMGE